MKSLCGLLAVLSACLMCTASLDAGGGHILGRPMNTSVGVGYMQGTPMYAGCNGCEVPCGVGCGPRCPGLLAKIAGGIDHVLKAVFCGHRFCDPCGVVMCGDCVAAPACGCDAGFDGVIEKGTLVPGGPGDPFIEDPQLPAATESQTRHYQLWNMPRPVTHYRVVPNAGTRSSVRSTAVPRRIDVSEEAQPLPAASMSSEAAIIRNVKPAVRPTSTESTDLRLPRNPLRD